MPQSGGYKSTNFRLCGYCAANDTGLYYCNARYYSPKWRRFISPDDTAYLDPESVNGLNLYCYCGNNPITYRAASIDCCPPVDVLVLEANIVVAAGKRGTRFRRTLYRENYMHNLAIDSDPSTSTYNRLLDDQDGPTGRRFVYGKHPASWNACETIAIHNAKVLLGIDSTLSRTMLDCQNAGIMIGNGFFGSNPLGIGRVLRGYGIPYYLVRPRSMTEPGVYIISYWNGFPLLSSLHTVAVQYDGSEYMAYNVANGTAPIDLSSYGWRFIIGYYLGG